MADVIKQHACEEERARIARLEAELKAVKAQLSTLQSQYDDIFFYIQFAIY